MRKAAKRARAAETAGPGPTPLPSADEVRAAAHAEREACVRALIEVRDDEDASDAARVAASRTLVEWSDRPGPRAEAPIPESELAEAEATYRDICAAIGESRRNPAAMAALLRSRLIAHKAILAARRAKPAETLTLEQAESTAAGMPDRLLWVFAEEWARRYPDWAEARHDAQTQ